MVREAGRGTKPRKAAASPEPSVSTPNEVEVIIVGGVLLELVGAAIKRGRG
jgi:hypothetical protein